MVVGHIAGHHHPIAVGQHHFTAGGVREDPGQGIRIQFENEHAQWGVCIRHAGSEVEAWLMADAAHRELEASPLVQRVQQVLMLMDVGADHGALPVGVATVGQHMAVLIEQEGLAQPKALDQGGQGLAHAHHIRAGQQAFAQPILGGLGR